MPRPPCFFDVPSHVFIDPHTPVIHCAAGGLHLTLFTWLLVRACSSPWPYRCPKGGAPHNNAQAPPIRQLDVFPSPPGLDNLRPAVARVGTPFLIIVVDLWGTIILPTGSSGGVGTPPPPPPRPPKVGLPTLNPLSTPTTASTSSPPLTLWAFPFGSPGAEAPQVAPLPAFG